MERTMRLTQVHPLSAHYKDFKDKLPIHIQVSHMEPSQVYPGWKIVSGYYGGAWFYINGCKLKPLRGLKEYLKAPTVGEEA